MFYTTDSKYSSRRSRLRIDMISCPQGDVKHMGHVGLDGAYFGDIEFMSTNAPKVNLRVDTKLFVNPTAFLFRYLLLHMFIFSTTIYHIK